MQKTVPASDGRKPRSAAVDGREMKAKGGVFVS